MLNDQIANRFTLFLKMVNATDVLDNWLVKHTKIYRYIIICAE